MPKLTSLIDPAIAEKLSTLGTQDADKNPKKNTKKNIKKNTHKRNTEKIAVIASASK